MQLDPYIQACVMYAEAQVCSHMLAHGCSHLDALAALAEQDQLVTDATSCGVLTTASRGRSFRHATYSNGTRKPPASAKVTGPFTGRDGSMFYRVERDGVVVGERRSKVEAKRLASEVK